MLLMPKDVSSRNGVALGAAGFININVIGNSMCHMKHASVRIGVNPEIQTAL